MAKRSVFYKIYFTAIAVFFVLLTGGLCLLYAWLNAYEQALPGTAVQEVFARYIETGDIYTLSRLCGYKGVSPYEPADRVNAAFKTALGGQKPQLREAAHILNSSDVSYTVTGKNQTPILHLTLKKQSAGKLGIRPYSIDSVAFDPSLYTTVTVSAPQDVQLTVNGVPLKGEKPLPQALPDAIKNLNGSDKFEVLHTYALKNMLNDKPEITAQKNGKALTVKAEAGGYTVAQAIDEAEQKAVQDFALAAAKAYAAYMQNDASFAQAAKYLDPSTAFYQSVKTTPAYFAWQHNGYSFTNVRFGSMHRYSTDIWRCRVLFTQVLKFTTTYSDPFDKYVYLRRGADGWKVIDMLAGES